MQRLRDTFKYPIQNSEGTFSPLMVLHSNAGYYLGRKFTDKKAFEDVGSRESEYFITKKEAEIALETGDFEWRDCFENQRFYEETLRIVL